jgi:hypothetical protein
MKRVGAYLLPVIMQIFDKGRDDAKIYQMACAPFTGYVLNSDFCPQLTR